MISRVSVCSRSVVTCHDDRHASQRRHAKDFIREDPVVDSRKSASKKAAALSERTVTKNPSPRSEAETKEEPPQKMGLASSAGAFPPVMISVRFDALHRSAVTPIILPSSNGFDSGVSLPARPQLCPATSQPVPRFELSKYRVTVTSHLTHSAIVNPSRKRSANIPRPLNSSREIFRQNFPEQSTEL